MRQLKKILKIVSFFIWLGAILLIVLINAENYEIISKKNGNKITKVEVKEIFGKIISKSTINSTGMYDGPSKSWHIFNNKLRNEGNFNNGYWHDQWKDYDRKGRLIMIREWDLGVLKKVFTLDQGSYIEVSKDKWPSYVNVKQAKPERIHQ